MRDESTVSRHEDSCRKRIDCDRLAWRHGHKSTTVSKVLCASTNNSGKCFENRDIAPKVKQIRRDCGMNLKQGMFIADST
jgi:hypothetical protein